MRKRVFPGLLTAIIAVVLSGGASLATDDRQQDPVSVGSTEIVYLETVPVQVELLVSGDLPSPCHEADWDVSETATTVEVQIWSTSDPAAFCAAVLEPFEVSVPLGSYDSADLEVTLNGATVGRIEIGGEASSMESGLASAGWSFGMCAGYCGADLSVDGAALVQSGHARAPDEQLYEHHGTLTAEGLARLDDAVAALADVTLEDTYGCPDCADGGAAYVVIATGDGESRHAMEFGNPPEVLADVYDLSTAVMSALESCEASALVEVAEDCTAFMP
jgi:hypothetical protein